MGGKKILKKVFTKCKVKKGLDHFHKRKDGIYGRRADCIECRKPIKSQYYTNNRETLIKASIKNRKDRLSGIYKETFTEKERDIKRKNYIKRYNKERYLNDIKFKLNNCIRGMLHRILSGSSNSYDKLGYTFDKLKSRIEFNFKCGMNWDNYGDWVIDHKKPVILFLNQGIEDPKLINMLCNLQPLWYKEKKEVNLKKRTVRTGLVTASQIG